MTSNKVFYREVCERWNQASCIDQVTVLQKFGETADYLPDETLDYLDKQGFSVLVFQSAAQKRATDALSRQFGETANKAFEKLLSVRPTIFAPVILQLLNWADTANTVTSHSENEPDNPPLDFKKTMGLLTRIAEVQPDTFFPHHQTISNHSDPSREGAAEWQRLQEITNPFNLMAQSLSNEALQTKLKRTGTRVLNTP